MLSERWISSAALTMMGAAVLLLGARTSGDRNLDLVTVEETVTTASFDPPSVDQPPTHNANPEGIVPARIRIPAIGVNASVTELGMLSPTEMETPEDFSQAGWLDLSREPGEIGPSIVAGHVDSYQGPAVFFRLRELSAGDEIVLEAADGQTRTFVVEDRGQYPKSALPSGVFGFGQNRPELRLITCGGTFDRSSRHYVDNVVVYAALAEGSSP